MPKRCYQKRNPAIPLTNNEAERRISDYVIQRKISYGTTSDAVDKLRDRMYSLIETCKNRNQSSLSVTTMILKVGIVANIQRKRMKCSMDVQAAISHFKKMH